MTVVQLIRSLMLCRDAGITPFVWGEHGIGKSSGVAQMSELLNIGMIDMRCAQMESADLRGLPTRELDENGRPRRTMYLPPADMPSPETCSPSCSMWRKAGKEMHATCKERKVEYEEALKKLSKKKGETAEPEHYCRGILFLDELNRSNDDVLQAVFQLVWDKGIGTYLLPPTWSIVVAGNFSKGYMVNAFNDMAFLDRFCHLTLSVGDEYCSSWGEWMTLKHGDHSEKILQFVGFNNEHLVGAKKGEARGDLGFSITPTPRSWSSLSAVEETCKEKQYNQVTKRIVMAGLIGLDLALSYEKFAAVVFPRDIIENFTKVKSKLKGTGRNQYAGLTWGIVSAAKELGMKKADKKKMDNVCAYMEHLAKTKHRDLAVVLGSQLCSEQVGDFGAGILSNAQLAKAINRINKSFSKAKLNWVDLITKNPILHKLMENVSYGKVNE